MIGYQSSLANKSQFHPGRVLKHGDKCSDYKHNRPGQIFNLCKFPLLPHKSTKKIEVIQDTPNSVFGVNFPTSISTKCSHFSALIFMLFPPFVCHNQRKRVCQIGFDVCRSTFYKCSKIRYINENQLIFFRMSSINRCPSYARRSAHRQNPPACR